MKNIILKNSSGLNLLVFFVASNLVYLYMLFVSIPMVMQFSNGIRVLDMLPGGYDFPYVNALFDILGEEGRHAYLYKQLPADLIYPALFAISTSLLLAFFLKKLKKQNSAMLNLVYLPVFGGLADYAENIGTIRLLMQYPDITENAVQVNSVFTILKSALVTVSLVVLLVLLLVYGYRYFLYKQRKPAS